MLIDRQMLDKFRPLRLITDKGRQWGEIMARVNIVNRDLATRRHLKPSDEPPQRRFASGMGTDQRDQLPILDL
jgi:hypothetical protein